MNKKLFGFILIFAFFTQIALGAIEFNGTEYEASFSVGDGNLNQDLPDGSEIKEVADKIGEGIEGFDPSAITVSSTLDTATDVFEKGKDISDKTIDYLDKEAGIDLVGILKGIASWFVLFIEWLVNLIKGFL